MAIEAQIEAALAQVRPRLAMHRGDVEFLRYEEDGTVVVRMTGTCDGCPLAATTLKLGIEALLVETVEGVHRVVNESV